MKKADNPLYVYVYLKGDRGDFWIFDGQLYHHFVWKVQGVWYIRSRPYLPAYLYGACVLLNSNQQRALQQEAARYAIPLAFYEDKQACEADAWQAGGQQAIFGMTPPAGYLTSDGLVVYYPNQDIQ